jgi:hypothetical protein
MSLVHQCALRNDMVVDRDRWWQEKTQKGRALVDEINELAERAGASGFQTTKYVLDLAATELLKEIERKD